MENDDGCKVDSVKIIALAREFNSLVKNAIDGPNCIDPNVCDGNCCFIHIDIPKTLALHYIKNNWAQPADFQRGATFAFEINVNLNSLRCVFYEKKLNGCTLHKTGVKTPQCWVYPTGLDPNSVKDTCKKASGWKIIDPKKTLQAKEILEDYVNLCKKEAEFENTPTQIKLRLTKELSDELLHTSPFKLAGIQDGWDSFHILEGEGFNIGLRSMCSEIGCDKNFFECPEICSMLQKKIICFLNEKLPIYIEKQGFRKEYTFMELR